MDSKAGDAGDDSADDCGGDSGDAGAEPETGVINQRSNPEPVSEPVNSVRPDPTAELTPQVLAWR